MPIRSKYIRVVLLYLVVTFYCYTLSGQYLYTNYDYSNGLPLREVQTFAQDSFGFIWMGGPDGLVRFDGNGFLHFTHDGSDSTSIAGNIVSDIKVSPSGTIWISFDDNGISQYDHKTKSFRSKKYSLKDKEDFPKYTINTLCVPDDSVLWMASGREGLYLFDIHEWESLKADGIQGIRSIIEDEDDHNHLLFAQKGIYRIHRNTLQAEKISDKGHGGLMRIGDKIWSHDYFNFLNSYNLVTKEEERFEGKFPSSIRGRIVLGDDIWLGTNNGIEIFNTITKSRKIIQREINKVHSLLSNEIYELFLDREERIWIGTDKGISVIDPNIDRFSKISFVDEIIYSDIALKTDHEYYATSFYSSEVQLIDFDKERVKKILKKDDSRFSGASSILNSKGKTYIHFYNGLGVLDTKNDKVSPFSGENVELIERRGNVDMLIDTGNNLWVAQREENQIISLNLDSGDNKIYPLYAEPKDLELQGDSILWIPCIGKIFRYNLHTMALKEISLDIPAYASLYGEAINIHCPTDSVFWISSRVNGIWKSKYENDSLILLKKYGLKEGLSSMNPLQVMTDKSGRLVVRTRSGIAIYNNRADRFVSYDQRNGLDAQFMHGTKIIGDSLFVFYKGMSLGNLKELKTDHIPPEVFIESVIFNSERINNPGQESIFSHKENNVQIEYNALNLSNPNAVRYRYRLGETDDWVFVDNNTRKVFFTSLVPGSYSFQVESTIDGAKWSSPKVYNFTINPPYWKTWWFRLLVFLTIAGVVYAFIRWREHQIKLIGNMRTRMTELENEALRAQMNPHFIFNSLNSIKSFIINNKKEEAADYLTTFAELIRTILKNSKNKNIPLAEEIKALDLYMEIENIRLENKFDVQWGIADNIKSEAILVPPLTLQPFVENAIWHGFIHKEGKGHMVINIKKEKEHLNVSIIDNGIGRKKSKEIEKNHFRKRSFGIAITQQRLGYNDKLKNNVEIIDHYDENGIASGTEVKLQIPFMIIGDKSIISSSRLFNNE